MITLFLLGIRYQISDDRLTASVKISNSPPSSYNQNEGEEFCSYNSVFNHKIAMRDENHFTAKYFKRSSEDQRNH